ncbi:hypothetical protein WG66_016002 [Moniliophthora roreri]|uniref:Putative S-adenosyl-L-methionine-dependent methyltransferase n=1 Tax=Moniliophthora roreri TaxID=221103 RepID=A0A0W0G8C5_MONRR|nr:hypothetical protein WG66_016002 [Moniliophthora roreri]
MASPLTALVDIISNGVGSIESAYKEKGASVPSLDVPFAPGPLDNDPALEMTIRTVIAASLQLIANIRHPMENIQEAATAFYMSAALDTVNEAHVANVLIGAGPEGLHVDEIAKEVGIESPQLARVLRYLATRHIFREVKPNVFAHNRASALLTKRAPLHEIRENPVAQYDDSPAAAFVGHVAGEALKGGPYLSSYLLGGHKEHLSPFNMSIGVNESIWQWWEQPGNEMRPRRFATAMKGGGERFPPSIYIEAFDWASLNEGAVVVDVGGGVGPVTLALHKAFPQITCVVQDLPPVISEAQKFWESEAPNAVPSGKVKLQVHNFFEPQAEKNAAVYFLRLVLHDWPNNKSQDILRNLRASANDDTKLILFDMVVPHACAEASPIPGVPVGPPAPPPLLSNFAAGPFITMVDIQMLNLMNGMERTMEGFVELGKETGWKLESFKPGPLTAFVFSAV